MGVSDRDDRMADALAVDEEIRMQDDLQWTTVEPRPPAAPPRPCRRHVWRYDESLAAETCWRCGRVRDPVVSRRGLNNRKRGNAIELEVAKRLGLKRVGMYGGPSDGEGEFFVAQVKSGGAFPERLWRWLQALPHDTRTRVLVVTDAPGPGHKRRALVVLDLDDWTDLHGEMRDETT